LFHNIFLGTFTPSILVSAFSEIYYWLLLGAGTGFSVESKHLKKLPKLYGKVELNHTYEEGFRDAIAPELIEWGLLDCTYLQSKWETVPYTEDELALSDEDFINSLKWVVDVLDPETDDLTLVVGDSKEGWANAVRILLSLNTFDKKIPVTIDYSFVRPEGERLKTFGGRASGYKSLASTLDNIQSRLADSPDKIDSVTATDICNLLAENVACGGTRRASQIALGDAWDFNFAEMKKDLWYDPNKASFRKSRSMSNNSMMLYECPSKQYLENIFDSIKTNGDPGFVAIGNCSRPEVEGTNPCAEINLRSKQCCNLTTLNLYNFVKNGKLDWGKLGTGLVLSTRAGSRMTLVNQWHPTWDANQKADRLLGQSMTGIMDAFCALGKDDDLQWQADFWKKCRNIVRAEADKYHNVLGIERSKSVTTIKPEGTISQLPTVSSGIHRNYSPHYLRRVRFSKSDPLSHSLQALGLKPEPEYGEGTLENSHTWVFTFPIKSNAEIRQIDEPSLVQLERYKVVQENYVESHNVSITVNVDASEWEKVTNWTYDNFEIIGGVSFLPKFDPNHTSHPLLPYEPADKKVVSRLEKQIPNLKEEELISEVAKLENQQEEHAILEDNCSSGSCPTR